MVQCNNRPGPRLHDRQTRSPASAGGRVVVSGRGAHGLPRSEVLGENPVVLRRMLRNTVSPVGVLFLESRFLFMVKEML
ncbi:hypothetical protein CBM2585_A40217 [Cupriavidus taiwanensis]|nr:hypothetical protein CBM2585_A40217 [Cupriavidus taiwanensis]